MRLFFTATLFVVSIPALLHAGADPCSVSCSDYQLPCERTAYIHRTTPSSAAFVPILEEYFPDITSDKTRHDTVSFQEYRKRVSEILIASGFEPIPLRKVGGYRWYPDPCASNSYLNKLLFIESAARDRNAVQKLPDLVSVRDRIGEICVTTKKEKQLEILASIQGLKTSQEIDDYSTYLTAIFFFYTGNYPKALETFRTLHTASSGWVRETARYLTGRIFMVVSQEEWDGYWYPENIDTAMLGDAERAFDAYLLAYPQGRYAESAKNIKRRLYYLAGDQARLNRALQERLEESLSADSPNNSAPVIWEVLAHYECPTTPHASPFLVAFCLLRGRDIPLSEREKDQNIDGPYPELSRWISNMRLFDQGRFDEIVEAFPKGKITDSLSSTGNYILLAEALERLERYGEARRIWLDILSLDGRESDHLPQIALANNYLLSGEIEALVAKGSGISDKGLMKEILEHLASDALLERILKSEATQEPTREITKHVLLTRYLLQKQYRRFLEFLHYGPHPGIFLRVKAAVRTLASHTDDPKALFNVGYFLHHRQMRPPESCQYSGLVYRFKSQYGYAFEGDTVEPPFYYYKRGLAQFDADDHSIVEAKLLHYATYCFRDTDCHWHDVPQEENKGQQWFAKIHKKYPGTKWAKRTKYYY